MSEAIFERKYGTEITKIYADINERGDLEVSSFDAGPMLEKMFGDDDYEYGFTIQKADFEIFSALLQKFSGIAASANLPDLIFSLKTAFEKGIKFSELKAICLEKGLEINSWSY
jgi:hypothetical protein